MKHAWVLVIGLWAVVGALVCSKPMHSSTEPEPPEHKWNDFGKLNSCEITHGTFIGSTTFKTTKGTFNIAGAITGACVEGTPILIRDDQSCISDGNRIFCRDE